MTKIVQFKLGEALYAGLKEEAKRDGVSVDDFVTQLLENSLASYRATKRTLKQVNLLENLPESLTNVDETHPVFDRGQRGRGPFTVKVVPAS